MQLGAELYGQAGIEGDFEILSLMLATLETIGICDVHLRLWVMLVCCVAYWSTRTLSPSDEDRLLSVLQRKAPEDLDDVLGCCSVTATPVKG